MTHRPNAITHTQEYTVLPEVVRHTFIIFRLFTTPNLCPPDTKSWRRHCMELLSVQSLMTDWRFGDGYINTLHAPHRRIINVKCSGNWCYYHRSSLPPSSGLCFHRR